MWTAKDTFLWYKPGETPKPIDMIDGKIRENWKPFFNEVPDEQPKQQPKPEPVKEQPKIDRRFKH
jgi:hypothetical protein